MKITVLALFSALAFVGPVHAAACTNGVYRAGCVGPNGAAMMQKPNAYHPQSSVSCASGPYRAGCAGLMAWQWCDRPIEIEQIAAE
jgi:hypothetical protein